jgi:hypothetical protein
MLWRRDTALGVWAKSATRRVSDTRPGRLTVKFGNLSSG